MDEKNLVTFTLRKTLVQLNLLLTQATTELSIAEREYYMNSKFDKLEYQRRAMDAKIRMDSYKIFIKDLKTIKQQTFEKIELVLEEYSIINKEIFFMRFLKGWTQERIAQETCYSVSAVKKILKKQKKLLEIKSECEDDKEILEEIKEGEDNG